MSLQGVRLGEDRLHQLAGIKSLLPVQEPHLLPGASSILSHYCLKTMECLPTCASSSKGFFHAACVSAVTQFAVGENSSTNSATAFTCETKEGSRAELREQEPP